MSATTYDALFDLRGQLETSIGSAIADDISTYTRNNSAVFQKDRARFELRVTIGTPLGHKKILSNDDRRYDMWNFSASIVVITSIQPQPERIAGESVASYETRCKANANFHAQLVAHVDAYLSQLQLASKDDYTNFPVLTLLLLLRTGIVPAFKPEDGYEMSAINFTGQFGIRPEAWQQ